MTLPPSLSARVKAAAEAWGVSEEMFCEWAIETAVEEHEAAVETTRREIGAEA